MKKSLLIFALLFTFQIFSQETNNEILEKVIIRMSDSLEGNSGNWRFSIKDRLLICITDENHNRMRIISPITEVSALSGEEILNSLLANFHTALDVKYAISEEVLWSVFIHPLRELSEAQIEDAISQVYFAAETFGSTYSSSNLVFPGSLLNQEPEEEKQKTIKLQKG